MSGDLIGGSLFRSALEPLAPARVIGNDNGHLALGGQFRPEAKVSFQFAGATSMAQPSLEENIAMRDAVDRALRAKDQSGKAGIAASIVLDGVIIGRGENEVRLQSDPTKHAEMVALTAASHHLGTTDLSGCVMISTLQPCEMCLAAMRFAGIKRVIFGATQDKVAEKYFVFPRLSLADFQNAGEPFEAIGGQLEDDVLLLYADGQE